MAGNFQTTPLPLRACCSKIGMTRAAMTRPIHMISGAPPTSSHAGSCVIARWPACCRIAWWLPWPQAGCVRVTCLPLWPSSLAQWEHR